MQTGGDVKHYASTESIQRCIDRPVGSKFFYRYGQWQRQCKTEKKFHLHLLIVWIGSRSTFVLCTALLTAEYTEGDRAQSEGQQAL